MAYGITESGKVYIMNTNKRPRLPDVATEVLRLWLQDIAHIQREYEDDEHLSGACAHCQRAALTGFSVLSRCRSCIWQVMSGAGCDGIKNPFNSNDIEHNKHIHIARCKRWTKRIDKELARRSACQSG